jgi:hypothetical protein
MTLQKLISTGNIIQNAKRKRVMFQYGATIGPARYPMFIPRGVNTSKVCMLPRPVLNCRPGNKANLYLQSNIWIQDLVMDMAELTLSHLMSIGDKKSCELLHYINFSLTTVPSCLRICNSFFTTMIIVGDIDEEGVIPIHVDQDDHISAILTLGDRNLKGGSTIYLNGVNTKDTGDVVHKIPFQHGRCIIGNFESVYHGVEAWIGTRITLSLSLHRHVLEHFIENGVDQYNQFVKAGYPSKDFIAY